MKIVFSKHALLKINQRGLKKTKVLETVTHPDFIQPSYNFREERYRLYTKNHLKVIVKIRSNDVPIVTAHWVARLKIK
jgi:precorrin-3B methylase